MRSPEEALALVQPQARLARVRVRTVALEAAIREERPHLAVEADDRVLAGRAVAGDKG